VHTTFLGGGLGRKIEQDYISQAIQTAMAVPNKPVKLTWMREEDFANDNFRPMAAINLKRDWTVAILSVVGITVLPRRPFLGNAQHLPTSIKPNWMVRRWKGL